MTSRRLCLFLLIALLGISVVGCGWFRRKPKPVVAQPPIEAPTATPTPDIGPVGPRAEYLANENLKPVYFDYDRSDVRADQVATLDADIAYAKANPTLEIQVEGNCDERGTVEYNFALGNRRADSIKAYMVSHGVPADKVSTISKGEENPVDPGHSEAAWAKNRRAEFKTR